MKAFIRVKWDGVSDKLSALSNTKKISYMGAFLILVIHCPQASKRSNSNQSRIQSAYTVGAGYREGTGYPVGAEHTVGAWYTVGARYTVGAGYGLWGRRLSYCDCSVGGSR